MLALAMGERIAAKMVERGYRKPSGKPDVSRFCREKGYLSQYVYEWIKGRRPNDDNLRRLANDLQVSTVWLLLGDEGVDEVLHGESSSTRGTRRRPLRARPARYRRRVVPESRPVEEPAGGLEQRLARLEAEGLLSRNPAPPRRFRPVARRPGGLERFLESRE